MMIISTVDDADGDNSDDDGGGDDDDDSDDDDKLTLQPCNILEIDNHVQLISATGCRGRAMQSAVRQTRLIISCVLNGAIKR